MSRRALVIKRRPDRLNVCALRRGDGRCSLSITRVVEAWNERLQAWQPELRLCHLHALEYVTGKPVYLPTFAEQQIIMRDLGA